MAEPLNSATAEMEPETAPLNPESPLNESAQGLSASHLDGLTVEEPAGTIAEPGASAGPAAGAVVDRATFAKGFVGMFNVAEAMTGLKSLHVADGDAAAQAAADAVYDIAEEVAMLRFLIQPGSKWVQRAVVIAAFAMPMARGVSEEVKARHAKAVRPGAKAANDQPADPLAWAPKNATA